MQVTSYSALFAPKIQELTRINTLKPGHRRSPLLFEWIKLFKLNPIYQINLGSSCLAPVYPPKEENQLLIAIEKVKNDLDLFLEVMIFTCWEFYLTILTFLKKNVSLQRKPWQMCNNAGQAQSSRKDSCRSAWFSGRCCHKTRDKFW